MKYLVPVFVLILSVSCSRQAARVAEGGLLHGQTTSALQPETIRSARATAPEPELALAGDLILPSEELSEPVVEVSEWDGYYDPDTTIVEEDTTPEPVMQPLILAGAATTGVGIASTALLFTGPFALVLIPLLLIAGGAALTTIGYKKLKIEPEKYKGEKLARLVYYSLVVVGAAAMLLPVYLLFKA